MSQNHFVYKLIPPRTTFAGDMNDAEQAIMGRHAEYWTALFEEGRAVLFGVVLDRAGAWGLAVVEAEGEHEVRALASDDPAVKTGLCTFDVALMPRAVVRSRRVAA